MGFDDATESIPGATPSPGATFQRGATVGRFVILERVGAGAMGTVYSAWDPQLSRRVALKVLTNEIDSIERARTLREARALAQLAHPNVVRVFELGEVGGAPFIAMELIEGSSLGELMKTPLPEQRLFDLFIQAGSGLAAVHALGIVHRDFKPGNVLVGLDRRVCIGDFGLAIASASSDDTGSGPSSGPSSPGAALLQGALTEQGMVAGTPPYMAPEQRCGLPLDGRADQFAFAVALWQGLFGHLPFGRGGLRASEPRAPLPPPKRSLAGLLVEPVLRRAMALDPNDRYADMRELLFVIERARRRPMQIGATLGTLLIVAIIAIGAAPRVFSKDPCGARALAAAAMPEDVRARLQVTGPNSLASVGVHVEAWTSQWVRAAEVACERSNSPGRAAVQACLDRRLLDLTALTSVLTTRGDTLETALPAVLALPSPGSCLAAHDGDEPVDIDRALERRLSDARAEFLAGRPAETLAIARDVAAAARATGDARLHAEAQYLVGLGATGTGDLAHAEEALRQAIAGAMTNGAHRLEAEAWIDLLSLVGDRARRFDEAERLIPIVRAAAGRVSDDLEVQGHARFVEAIVRGDVGDLSEARPLAVEAIALAEARLPRDPRAVSSAHSCLGNLHAALGELEAAEVELMRARQALEGALPRSHPSFAVVSNNLGAILVRKNDLTRARAAFLEAVSILDSQPKTPLVGVPLDNLATLALEEGSPDEARALFLRAEKAFLQTYGTNHERTAAARMGLSLVAQSEAHFEEAAGILDGAIVVLEAQNWSSRSTLDAVLARATLAFEAQADVAEQDRRVAAVQAHLPNSSKDDLRGARAELALLRAAQAIRRNDPATGLAQLELAHASAAFVRWRSFDAIVGAWGEVAAGRAPPCASLAINVPLARMLRRECQPRAR